MRLDHIAIGVSDLENVLQMFQEHLGVEVRRRSTVPGTSTQIAFVEEPETRALLEVVHRQMSSSATLEHLAFRVEDVDAKFAEFKKRGWAVEKEPHDIPAAKARSALLRDRSGLRIQLISYF